MPNDIRVPTHCPNFRLAMVAALLKHVCRPAWHCNGAIRPRWATEQELNLQTELRLLGRIATSSQDNWTKLKTN